MLALLELREEMAELWYSNRKKGNDTANEVIDNLWYVINDMIYEIEKYGQIQTDD